MRKLKVHFLGIAGSGQSAIAQLAASEGFEISGCDSLVDNEFTKNFDKKILHLGHSGDHLKDVDILSVTPAIFSADPQNPELKAAEKKNIPILTWQEFMGKYLQKDKFVIAVCGTHGKSTTTAMIGRLLEDAGLDPTVELGALVQRWEANFRIGKSRPVLSGTEGYFVCEADEFNENYLNYHPDITVVTNIEMDHPETFSNLAAVEKSFEKFLGQTKQTIVANLEDNNVAHVLKDVMKKSKVSAVDYSKNKLNLDMLVPGKHNQLNALAAFQVGVLLGIDPYIIKFSLENFTGIGRRFELLGNINGALTLSDFAHHPTEIRATIEAAKERYKGKKIWVIFQPHMYSRTKALFKEFVQTFKNLPVQKVVLLDIYKAREDPIEGVRSEKIVEEVNKKTVIYSKEEDLKKILKEVSKDNVIFFIGAGPIDQLAASLVE